MNILALDLGTTAGWAYGSTDHAEVMSGSWKNKAGRYDGGGMRYVRFRGFLSEINDHAKPDMIVYEEVRNHAGVDAAHVYGGLMAHLTAWCESRDPKIPYVGVPVGTIKKYWTGKGNANKDAMILEAIARGFSPKDDNEADALALLHLALEKGGEL